MHSREEPLQHELSHEAVKGSGHCGLLRLRAGRHRLQRGKGRGSGRSRIVAGSFGSVE